MSNGPYDLSQLEGLTYGEMVFKLRRDLEFAMPPVGTVKHRTIISGKNWTRYTWRCEVDNCWYVCTPASENDLASTQAYHKKECPSSPRRESLPSGLSEIQKLWREVDDIISALKSNVEYRGMAGAELKAYASGISFSIVMKETALFPTNKAVAAEGVRRWQMSKGHIPFAATPSRFSPDYSSLGADGGWKPESGVVSQGKSAPTRKPPKKVAQPAAKLSVNISGETLQAIKNALLSGMFSKEDIETMYSVSLSELGLSMS